MFGSSLFSIGQIAISANWFLEGNYIAKIKSILRNKFFWVLISIYLLHIVGLLFTQNQHQGFVDLGNKVPLLILPILFFTTKPLTDKELNTVLYSFFLAVVLSSFYCYAVFLGITSRTIINPRDASVFMSHIRFSLCIAFTICGLIYFSFKENKSGIKIIFWILNLWLFYFLFQLEMMTGIVCMAFVSTLLLINYAFKKLNKRASLLLIISLVLLIAAIAFETKRSITLYDADFSHPENTLLNMTANKNNYLHDTIYGLAENGNLIGINISDYELQKEWEKRSKIKYQSRDKKGNELRYTILHYLASKGCTKDSLGISTLSNQDIIHIENGYTNYLYTSASFSSRWQKLVWEFTKYKRGENPSGHTLTMRLEFWKTATTIIKKNVLIGVGTGDIQDSFNKTYIETHTKLDKRWWLRCHNQYLAITVAFGVLGLLLFLFFIIYPALALRKELHPLYWCFYIILLVSFITEDTLENQAGVTFFAFFNSIFIWLAFEKSKAKYHVN